MPTITTTVDIDRPQEQVFEYLTDLENLKEWSVELIDVTYDGDLREGATGSDIRRMGRKEIVMPWRVTRFLSPERVVFEYGDPFPATADFSIEALSTGTRVTCSTDLRPRGWWRLLAPLMAYEAGRTDRRQFEKVKAILEGTAAASEGGK